jgi:Beta-propeller repeat/HYDIN/CFA65/VesB-like, Ig-like domain
MNQVRDTSLAEGAARPRALEALNALPQVFEPNVGQSDAQVKFLSRGAGYGLFLTGSEAVLTLRTGSGRGSQTVAKQHRRTNPRRPDLTAPTVNVMRMKLAGANVGSQVVGLDPLPGSSNYFKGKNPKKWRRNVTNYAKVKYQDIYPGIDLVYYGNQRQLEYDFVVRPGADPKAIALTFNGSTKSPALTIDAAGDLAIATSGGEVRFHKPVLYQPQETPSGARQAVEGKFVLLAANRVGFEVAYYDRSKPLVIDPTMVYATFLGGSHNDEAFDVAADGSGNAYVTGNTFSTDFPTTNSGSNNGNNDVFVTKLNAAGSSLIYSTYLGGSGHDFASGIAVDANGNAFVAGNTFSTDFPATVGDTSCGTDGNCNASSFTIFDDAFVAKLNSSGVLAYATYLGGSGKDVGSRIRVDSSGNTFLTGQTSSADFPVPKGFQTVCSNCTTTEPDAFVAKLNATGSSVLYSTFLGGTSFDRGNDLALDASGNVWVIGQTDSPDFPTTSNALQPTDPDSGNFSDAFLAKINPAASGATSLVYSSYIGGDKYDAGYGIALDGSGNIYIAGESFSSEAPAGSSGFDTTPNGDDAVVAKLNPTATKLIYFTFLGGASSEFAYTIAVDSGGNAYVTGGTNSTNFPTASPLQSTNQGSGDAFLTKLSADGKSLVYSSYLGGTSSEAGFGLALDSSRNAYIVGSTISTDFPATTGSVQETSGGIDDAFAAKFAFTGPELVFNPLSLDFGSHLVGTTTTKTLTVTNTGNANLTITALTISGTNSGDFTLDSSSTCTTSTPVAPNGTCTVVIKSTVGAAGDRTAALAIASNAGSGNVPLTGKGTALKFAAASGSQTTATVAAGGTATYKLTIDAPGFVGEVDLTCTGVPVRASCTVTPAVVDLDGTKPGAFTVSVMTTARSLLVPQPPEGPGVVGWKLPPFVQLLGLLALLALAGLAIRHRRARWVFAAAMLCVLMWGACGGGGGSTQPVQTGTPAGTYNLVITGEAEGITKTVGLTLSVN